MKNEEDEEEKSHLNEVNPVIEFEKLDKGNYFFNIFGLCPGALTLIRES